MKVLDIFSHLLSRQWPRGSQTIHGTKMPFFCLYDSLFSNFFLHENVIRYAQIRTGYEVQNQKTAKTVVQYPLTNVHMLKSKKILFLRGPFEALRLKKVH